MLGSDDFDAVSDIEAVKDVSVFVTGDDDMFDTTVVRFDSDSRCTTGGVVVDVTATGIGPCICLSVFTDEEVDFGVAVDVDLRTVFVRLPRDSDPLDADVGGFGSDTRSTATGVVEGVTAAGTGWCTCLSAVADEEVASGVGSDVDDAVENVFAVVFGDNDVFDMGAGSFGLAGLRCAGCEVADATVWRTGSPSTVADDAVDSGLSSDVDGVMNVFVVVPDRDVFDAGAGSFESKSRCPAGRGIAGVTAAGTGLCTDSCAVAGEEDNTESGEVGADMEARTLSGFTPDDSDAFDTGVGSFCSGGSRCTEGWVTSCLITGFCAQLISFVVFNAFFAGVVGALPRFAFKATVALKLFVVDVFD